MRVVASLGLLLLALPLAGQTDERGTALRFRVGGDIEVDSAGREQVVVVVRGDAHVRARWMCSS